MTPSLILRAAGRGDIRFAVVGLSLLAGQPVAKTRFMVFASKGLGLKAIASRARFSLAQIELLTACIQTYLSVERDNRALSASKFQRLAAERLASMDLDLPTEIESDLLEILDGYANLRCVA